MTRSPSDLVVALCMLHYFPSSQVQSVWVFVSKLCLLWIMYSWVMCFWLCKSLFLIGMFNHWHLKISGKVGLLSFCYLFSICFTDFSQLLPCHMLLCLVDFLFEMFKLVSHFLVLFWSCFLGGCIVDYPKTPIVKTNLNLYQCNFSNIQKLCFYRFVITSFSFDTTKLHLYSLCAPKYKLIIFWNMIAA